FEARLLELGAEKERCERELARLSGPQRRQDPFAGTPGDLTGKLPDGVAVVDLIKARRWMRTPQGNVDGKTVDHYEAFVLRRGRPVAWIDLGPATRIDGSIERWRKQFARAGAVARGADRLPDDDDPTLAAEPPDQDLR